VKYPSVSDAQIVRPAGPWRTGSGANLTVPLSMDYSTACNYLQSPRSQYSSTPVDIRGFRLYIVRPILKSSCGSTEYHKIREEIVLCISGEVRFSLEDVRGTKQDFHVTPENGLWIPPFILHTYQGEADSSELIVLANTTFDHGRKETRDTYAWSEFAELQGLVFNETYAD